MQTDDGVKIPRHIQLLKNNKRVSSSKQESSRFLPLVRLFLRRDLLFFSCSGKSRALTIISRSHFPFPQFIIALLLLFGGGGFGYLHCALTPSCCPNSLRYVATTCGMFIFILILILSSRFEFHTKNIAKRRRREHHQAGEGRYS